MTYLNYSLPAIPVPPKQCMGKGNQLGAKVQIKQGEAVRYKTALTAAYPTLITLMSTPRLAFRGADRKLVLAFDVGTTYSGISYSVLDPGVIPEIKGVARFPAHEYISGAAKIPTIIYYDRAGNVKAVGAEAMRDGIHEAAEDEHWVKAEWFKLDLRSRVGAGKRVLDEIPPLPLNKTVVDVLADFLAYLFGCASRFIQETHANGTTLWPSVKDKIDFVLSHPNGWEGAQQAEMRRAAVLAKLIPDTIAGHARLSFVTEGEASLHFAALNGLPVGVMEHGEGVVIVDAGGGTVDISSYTKNIRESRVRFEEVAAPQCHFHGSVFVTLRAQLFLEDRLRNSPFFADIDQIVSCFDKTTKVRFLDSNEPQYIKFGGARDNDPSCNIRSGQLKLLGSDMATFFQPSVDCIVNAVLDQCKAASKPIFHVVLVGGLAGSDWLFNKVQETLLPHGLNTIRPENHVNKAASDGALSFYHDHLVRTRVSKIAYGIFSHIPVNPADLDHQQRLHNIFPSVAGVLRIKDHFSVILPKNTQVRETKEFRRHYFHESESKNDFTRTSTSVWCYRGNVVKPKWKDIDTENYTKLCTIEIDLSPNLPLSPISKPSGEGIYYRMEYEVILLFGLTELEAMFAWKENGVERRSPAKIIYDPDSANDGL